MVKISKFTVRTSGRRVFRRCMRKWGYQSSMRMNLQRRGTEQNINFWFGSAIHFAMEDFFGYNRFGSLQRAFQAYYAAFKSFDRPEGAASHYYLGLAMLDYFQDWYVRHNREFQFQTVWLDENKQEVAPGTPGARPLVEESFILNLGKEVWVRHDTARIVAGDEEAFYRDLGTEEYYMLEEPVVTPGEFTWEKPTEEEVRIPVSKVPIMYHGTFDRIVRDRLGRWWIMDWKTAKGADTNKLDTDDQISAYLWAAEQWFGRPIHGFMYVQLTKETPQPPKRVANGTLSTDKKQKTTHALYRAELIKDYKEVRRAPAKMIDFLNTLAELDTPEGDRFVRWDMVTRTKAQKESTYYNIMGEVELMTTPNLYLFPNPTRDCSWDCPFRDACIMQDNGQEEELQAWLDLNFEERPREEDGNIDPWRENIPWPDSPQGEALTTLISQMEVEAEQVLNLILPEKYQNMEDDN